MLKYDDIALPQIRPKDVLVEVHSAALDRGVWHLMSGLPYLIRILGYGFTGPKQIIPGLDVAGIVRKVGDNVPVP